MSGDRIAGLLGMICGLYWGVMGYNYGIWGQTGPASGFIPVIFGSLTFVLSTILIGQTFTRGGIKLSIGEIRTVVLISVFTGTAIFLLNKLGTMPTLGLLILLWLRFLERYPWAAVIKISVGTIAVAYLVFVVWLQVPFPTGWLGF
jgi:hypothetical protein